MNLYEIGNGWMGVSYVRCYVWTETEERARELAVEAFQKKYKEEVNPDEMVVKRVMSSTDGEFVTEPNDEGW